MKFKTRKNLLLGFSIALVLAGVGTFAWMMVLMFDGTSIYFLSSKIFFALKKTNGDDIKTITIMVKVCISLYAAISLINMGVGGYLASCYRYKETDFFIKKTIMVTLAGITIFGKVLIGTALVLVLTLKSNKNNKIDTIKKYNNLQKLKSHNKISAEEFDAQQNEILNNFEKLINESPKDDEIKPEKENHLLETKSEEN